MPGGPRYAPPATGCARRKGVRALGGAHWTRSRPDQERWGDRPDVRARGRGAEHQLKQKQQARWGGKKWPDTDYVFTTSKGTAIYASNVYRSFKALLKESKLPDIRFHDLRGSYASFLAANNVPVPALMNAMGHTDAKTTLAHYADVLDESKVQVAQTVEAVLNGPIAG